ncbi:MAG: hypothetical protein LBV09_03780, partial [Deferribacteraceae bacterium]|nr:hypothetical protein [Deferribacteraceae bacterium]
MQVVTIKKGVDLPISGGVVGNAIVDANSSEYALLADDFKYLKPKILVKEGDRVECGTPLLLDKNLSDLPHVSPISGTVSKIMRGEKRSFQGILIERDMHDSNPWIVSDRSDIKATLINTGFWMGFISRPFGGVADSNLSPDAIFVTAIDTRPLAPSVDVALEGRHDHFIAGVRTIAKLTEGNVFVCVAPDTTLPVIEEERIKTVGFSGAHPSGLAGTH